MEGVAQKGRRVWLLSLYLCLVLFIMLSISLSRGEWNELMFVSIVCVDTLTTGNQ
jgi:hypothetical protein